MHSSLFYQNKECWSVGPLPYEARSTIGLSERVTKCSGSHVKFPESLSKTGRLFNSFRESMAVALCASVPREMLRLVDVRPFLEPGKWTGFHLDRLLCAGTNSLSGAFTPIIGHLGAIQRMLIEHRWLYAQQQESAVHDDLSALLSHEHTKAGAGGASKLL